MNWLEKLRNPVFRARVEGHFWSRIDKAGECWIWQGSYSKLGYARFKVGKDYVPAQRVAWALTYGDVPDDKEVIRTCSNRKCVRPDHLMLGTHEDRNKLLLESGHLVLQEKGTPSKQWQTGYCEKGHELTPDNIIFGKGNTRCCKRCRDETVLRDKNKRAMARRKKQETLLLRIEMDKALKESVQFMQVMDAWWMEEQGLRLCVPCGEYHDLDEFRIDTKGRYRCRIRERAYREANSARINRNTKVWMKANPDKKSENHRKSRAKRRGAQIIDFTPEQWEAIKAAYKYRCAYCGKKKPLTQDHIIPLTKGGNHTASNIIPACQSCNSSKGNKLVEGIQFNLDGPFWGRPYRKHRTHKKRLSIVVPVMQEQDIQQDELHLDR